MADEASTSGLTEPLSPRALAQGTMDIKRRWSVHALCRATDPEIFFPPNDSPATEARRICASCPVRRQCLAYAVAADEPFGIWGGLTTEERRNLRRQLRRHPTGPTDAGSTK